MSDYLRLAEATLLHIDLLCDQFNEDASVDIDNQRVGNMLSLTFPNRSQIIINLQKPLEEIWVATLDKGYHFRWNGAHWVDTKSNTELYSLLSREASNQADLPIEFIAPVLAP